MFDFCSSEKIEQLYLLTTTAEKYFYKFGFQAIDRVDVPKEILQTKEFKDICPLYAITMYRNQ